MIFKCPSSGGCTYNGRNVAETDYDESFNISSVIVVSGTADYLFGKVTGLTTASTTTFTSGTSVKSLSISINGIVNY